MKSKIAEALRLVHPPFAIIWTDEKPQSAQEFKPGKWGCVMWMLAGVIRGRTAVFSKETFGCWGGGIGLGFGDQYLNFPGGPECFYYFLSIGNQHWDKGREVAKEIEPFVSREFLEDFIHGEGYVGSPELVKDFVESLPIMEVPAKYVVFKPLAGVDPQKDRPVVVVFLANPDQLSALVILANYGRKGNENVIIPYAAGCQTIGIYPYAEANSSTPRAVVGLTDISARLYTRKQLGRNLLTFAVPFSMFEEMEGNVSGSFLDKRTWKGLMREP